MPRWFDALPPRVRLLIRAAVVIAMLTPIAYYASEAVSRFALTFIVTTILLTVYYFIIKTIESRSSEKK
jgi:hypothetical protein